MATTSELRESVELRLQQVLDEADQLQRALDALTPEHAAPAADRDTTRRALPVRRRRRRQADPLQIPPRPAEAVPRPLDEDARVPEPAERAVHALRAELDAGLRTTTSA